MNAYSASVDYTDRLGGNQQPDELNSSSEEVGPYGYVLKYCFRVELAVVLLILQ